MKLIDVTVPIVHVLAYPGNTPFSLEPTKRGPEELSQVELAGNVRLLINTRSSQLWGWPEIEGLNQRDVEPGIYEMFHVPIRIVDADGAPARVVLRRS